MYEPQRNMDIYMVYRKREYSDIDRQTDEKDNEIDKQNGQNSRFMIRSKENAQK